LLLTDTTRVEAPGGTLILFQDQGSRRRDKKKKKKKREIPEDYVIVSTRTSKARLRS
jgi:hypothetical protein